MRWCDSRGIGYVLGLAKNKSLVPMARDEIDFVQRWLRERGETVPDPTAMHEMGGHQMSMAEMPGMAPMMPGMLSPEQMAQLKAATGPEFDRLFLTFMIQHHEGAITMAQTEVKDGQYPDAVAMAQSIITSQQQEIDTMNGILASL